MPASMSSARADALAERERRLVDELADDPPEHEPGRVADPLDVLAQRREEALGGARRPASSVSGPRVSSTRPRRRPAAAARGSRRRRRRGRARPASPRRSSIACGPPCSGGSSSVGAAVEDQERHLAVGLLGRARRPSPRPRRASQQLARRAARSPAITTTSPSPPPAAGAARGSSAAGAGRRGSRSTAAAGLAPVRGRRRPSARVERRRAPARLAEALLVERLARPRSRRRRRRGPSARTAPCGSRRRGGRCGRPARRRDAAPAASRSASRPNGRLQRLTRKPGPSAASITSLPIASPVRAGERERRLAGLLAGDDLEQPHQRRRVEEVHADDALGPRRGGGDRGDRQRGGVASPARSRGRRSRASAREQLALELERLGRRLDHQLARGERPRASSTGSSARGRGLGVGRAPAPALGALRAGSRAARSTPRSSASGTGSCSSVRAPASAASWAMPAPIVPAPTTPIEPGRTVGRVTRGRAR